MQTSGFSAPTSQLRGKSPAISHHAADVGIFKSTLLPSLSLHSALAVLTYAAARSTNRVELKDWLWPSAQVLNAWWSAIGQPIYQNNVSIQTAWSALSWDGKLLLSAVTAWGVRLFWHIASRSLRRGADDPRYETVKKEDGFWDRAFGKLFIPEALFQTIITLPFTAPFRVVHADPFVRTAGWTEVVRGLAVGLFSAGFAMEVFADCQIEAHRDEATDLCRDGVWSIVRHPNYLGDALVHASFPLFSLCTGGFHPALLLGPLANYAFLRFIGGDKENEATQEKRYKETDQRKYQQLQEWRAEKNSFWPKCEEVENKWLWGVVGCGVLGVVGERVVRQVVAT